MKNVYSTDFKDSAISTLLILFVINKLTTKAVTTEIINPKI